MDSLERVERLLALLLVHEMKGTSQREKAQQLSVAGFTNTEIADLLQTSAAVIATNLYSARKKSTRKRAKPK